MHELAHPLRRLMAGRAGASMYQPTRHGPVKKLDPLFYRSRSPVAGSGHINLVCLAEHKAEAEERLRACPPVAGVTTRT